jgi:hypothetical protein
MVRYMSILGSSLAFLVVSLSYERMSKPRESSKFWHDYKVRMAVAITSAPAIAFGAWLWKSRSGVADKVRAALKVGWEWITAPAFTVSRGTAIVLSVVGVFLLVRWVRRRTLGLPAPPVVPDGPLPINTGHGIVPIDDIDMSLLQFVANNSNGFYEHGHLTTFEDMLTAHSSHARMHVEESTLKLCRLQLIERRGGFSPRELDGFYCLGPLGRSYLVHSEKVRKQLEA